jgi:hypothetical protein
MKPNHTYFLLFLVSICAYSSLLCQQNLPAGKIARRAITIDASTFTANSYSINWHQPILVLKRKSNGHTQKEEGYLNASIGLGRSFLQESAILVPHSITFNIRLKAYKNKARFMELGYGGFAWHSTVNYISPSNKSYDRNKYGGGLLIGFRSNGPIADEKTFVFRVNCTAMVQKGNAFVNPLYYYYCFSGNGCRDLSGRSNKLIVRPLLNLSVGFGL